MTVIETIGHVNEQGQLEFEQPNDLPPGDVRIIIATFDADAEAIDDALWDAQFAATPQEVWEKFANKALKDFEEGRTRPLDPDSL